jgi:hypothetical protein
MYGFQVSYNYNYKAWIQLKCFRTFLSWPLTQKLAVLRIQQNPKESSFRQQQKHPFNKIIAKQKLNNPNPLVSKEPSKIPISNMHTHYRSRHQGLREPRWCN